MQTINVIILNILNMIKCI